MHTIKRDGTLVPFDATKIQAAIAAAFLKDASGNIRPGAHADSAMVREKSRKMTELAVEAITRRAFDGTVSIETIQDMVELSLMRSGEHQVARDYVLFRQARTAEREKQADVAQPEGNIRLLNELGEAVPLDMNQLTARIKVACSNVDGADLSTMPVQESVKKLMYDQMPASELEKALIMATRPLIEMDYRYSFVAARFLLDQIRQEAVGREISQSDMESEYPAYFAHYLRKGVEIGRIDPRLLEFDLQVIGEALCADRDWKFQYQGMQILYDRYLIHDDGRRIELPQALWMRVAMGLAINEVNREKRAIEFYQVLSTFRFVCSTPTLFNAGTTHPQLSSCFLTTVPDDLDGIFEAVKENALLSKYSGGLGNDWTPVRAMGAWIKGTNGKSQGVVPFLKVVNDTAVAVNQCFAPDTLVYTQNGATAISKIHKGDLVLGISGSYREVQERMTYAQSDPMVEIRVKHSLSPIRVTTGHPVLSIRGVSLGEDSRRTLKRLEQGTIKPEWVETGALQRGDYVAQVIPSEVIPLNDFTDDDAFLYGILLGDGHVGVRNEVAPEYGVTLNDESKAGLVTFVRQYLSEHGIHFWENVQHGSAHSIRWSFGRELVRNSVNGRFVTGGENPVLPFAYDDLYNDDGQKCIAPRFQHLPESQTLGILKGLLLTDGNVSRGKEISFVSASAALVENVRYLLLRLGIPCSGQKRDRCGEAAHTLIRKDGSIDTIANGISYVLRIPAYTKIAALVGCQPITKHHALRVGHWLFSRVVSVEPMQPVPFVCDLKVEGDESYMTSSFLAHNGGKRKGAVCAYLETWHLDMEEFLELRKNTGDDRRRTHDMNTANWIPDLFMERVEAGGMWTLFSPNEVPDLHDLYGEPFKRRYEYYEQQAEAGALEDFKRIPAVELWRKMLTMLFETGHPWITFKDPCNIRSPQQHVGVVHSSNLCSEITLNSSADETAVCNLGSVNLLAHLDVNPVVQESGDECFREDWPKDQLRTEMTPEEALQHMDKKALDRTIHTAMRMLDNVIDLNFYPTRKARNANIRHRAVGLGLMGFADALHQLNIPMDSEAAVTFADVSQEVVSFCAITSSFLLAQERGSYSSFQGSTWSRGLLPVDTLNHLRAERADGSLIPDTHCAVDPDLWGELRKLVAEGMRNSNCMAIAPTATISNIAGVSQGIDPIYQNLYVKSNLSGEFTVTDSGLVQALERLDLWDEVMVNDLKYFDGSLAQIDRVPAYLKRLYATAFEIDPQWLVKMAAHRQKWVDQSQSLNLYLAKPSGKKLDALYRLAWASGLKTTYYLRTMGATSAEKSTVEKGALNAVSVAPKACSILDPECTACE